VIPKYIKHTKRCETKRTHVVGLRELSYEESKLIQNMQQKVKDRVLHAQLYGPKALIRRANAGITADNKKVQCDVFEFEYY
jgi:hypothetical protein